MIIQTEHLGKVSVTVEKDYHNINKCYDKLTIVEEENEFRTYISRKPVPNGVELTDRNYWIPFSSLERQIVIDYNKFKNDVLFASAFHEKLDPTLPEGVAIIKQLFDKDNNLIIPKVSEEAVSDETGKTLKAKLAELTTTLSNTIDTYLNTYFADTIEKAEDIVNHPTYIGEDNYVYVWNRITKTYDKTSIYTRGEGFHVSKTFASVADMEAYTGTDLKEGDFVLIQSTPDDPDNAKLYTYSGTQGVYNYLVDMSGALGFTGKTPQFSIGSVVTVDPDVPASAALTPDGTDADGNPKYKLNLALPKGRSAEEIFVKGEGTNSVKHKNSDNNYTSGENSFTLGNHNNASGDNSFVLGEWNSAGRDSFVHGKMNRAGADKSHAEGNGTRCEGSVSHAEGSVTISNGSVSHSEGYGTVAHDMSHTEGVGAIVFRIKTLGNPNPIYKVISGVDTLSNVFKGFFIVTVVSNDDYHICTTSYATITNIEVREEDEEEGVTAEDAGIYITTNDNLVVDPSNDTKAYILVNAGFTPGSHIEGYYNLSATFNGRKSFINSYIHNLFDNNLINKIYGGHVEGIGNIIGGKYSHAEGALNSTNNAIVHLEGKGNIANADCQHVEGKFNEPDDTAAHIIGNGTDDAHRSNAAAFDWNGNLKIKGNLKDPQGNIIDATKFVIVNDHSGDGDDPNKIYIPSAESHKEVYDGLIEDEKIIAEAITRIHESLDDHLKLTDIHLTESLLTDIHNNTEKNSYLDKVIFNGHEYLDLNLPSGNLWATMNVGATRVEEEGYHFMWGNPTQLVSENDAVWSNCKYSNDGIKFAIKYNSHVNDNNYYHNSDIKFIVEANDDPARKLWGGLWRMPTIDDLIELFDNLYAPNIETINGVEVLSFQPKNNFQDPFFYIPFCSYWEDGVIHNYMDEDNNKGCVIANSDITGIDALTSTVLINGDSFTKNYAFPISAITGLCIRPVINLNK